LATELFLKACICRAGGEALKSHEIADLLKRYAELYPGEENRFPTPWRLSASDVDEVLGVKVFHGVDRAPDQLYRYGADKRGAASQGIQLFTPGYFLKLRAPLDGQVERGVVKCSITRRQLDNA
jgi:hypothetical protein